MEQKNINGGETCSGAYDRCDAEHPDVYKDFLYCMHVAAACGQDE